MKQVFRLLQPRQKLVVFHRPPLNLVRDTAAIEPSGFEIFRLRPQHCCPIQPGAATSSAANVQLAISAVEPDPAIVTGLFLHDCPFFPLLSLLHRDVVTGQNTSFEHNH
jgi:hypothetical protein